MTSSILARRLLLFTGLCLEIWLATACSTAGSATAANGAACVEKGDCASNLCLMSSMYGVATGWQDGACTQSCLGSTCPGTSVCIAMDSNSYCLGACKAAADCRIGYACDPLLGACVPNCTQGFSCGSKYICQTNGLCRTASSGGTGVPGSCSVDNDCRGTAACPGTPSQGCVCAILSTGTMACRAGCTASADCPLTFGGAHLTCATTGYCLDPAAGD